MKRRSKIQICINILNILNQRGLSRITHIMYDSNTNCSILKNHLTFMVQQELVEKKNIGNQRIAYGITPKGISLLHTFKEFKKLLPETSLISNQLSVSHDLV